MTHKIAPSILAADFANLQKDIEMVNESVMERIHTILDNTPESPLF